MKFSRKLRNHVSLPHLSFEHFSTMTDPRSDFYLSLCLPTSCFGFLDLIRRTILQHKKKEITVHNMACLHVPPYVLYMYCLLHSLRTNLFALFLSDYGLTISGFFTVPISSHDAFFSFISSTRSFFNQLVNQPQTPQHNHKNILHASSHLVTAFKSCL